MGMTMIYSKLGAVAAVAVLAMSLSGGAFAQAGGQGNQGNASPGYQQAGSDPNAAGPVGASKMVETPILYVTGIEVIHSQLDPKVDIIRVSGLASSQGWANPQLVPFFYGRPADDVLDLQFIADPPEQSQKAEGFVPISARFPIEAGNPFKGVRVRAAGNALTLKEMNGVVRIEIKKDDCKDCIGKKFVEKDKGQPGPGVVYGGDLPPDYRPIGPTHGVKGDVHSPNRINLVLDGDDKIVMAFWE
jgi:hypothetical protein